MKINKGTLRKMAKAGKIRWPVDVNVTSPYSKKRTTPMYVDEVPGVGSSFRFEGKNYRLRYVDGCFYPYVYEDEDQSLPPVRQGKTDK